MIFLLIKAKVQAWISDVLILEGLWQMCGRLERSDSWELNSRRVATEDVFVNKTVKVGRLSSVIDPPTTVREGDGFVCEAGKSQ